MVIGSGDIGKVLKEHAQLLQTDVIFFASGVSNSKCQDEMEYERERNLIKAMPKHKHLVYFSSLALHYNDKTQYVRHKRKMEAYINRHFDTYTIFRIGNITWGNNPHTIINHFKNQMANLQDLDIQDGHRYLLTREQLIEACKKIDINNRETIILSGRMIKISDIVEEIIQGKL